MAMPFWLELRPKEQTPFNSQYCKMQNAVGCWCYTVRNGKHISIIASCYGHSKNPVKTKYTSFRIQYLFTWYKSTKTPKFQLQTAKEGQGKLRASTLVCRHIEHLYFFFLSPKPNLST